MRVRAFQPTSSALLPSVSQQVEFHIMLGLCSPETVLCIGMPEQALGWLPPGLWKTYLLNFRAW